MAVVKGGSGAGSLRAAAMAAAVAVAVLTLMTNSINGCGAAVLVKSNVTSDHRYCFSAGNCLIAEDFDFDLEFLMDSHVARFLADPPVQTTQNSGNANKAAIPCDPGKPYKNCLPPAQPTKNKKNIYNRDPKTPPP